jgi:hypothetical protein
MIHDYSFTTDQEKSNSKNASRFIEMYRLSNIVDLNTTLRKILNGENLIIRSFVEVIEFEHETSENLKSRNIIWKLHHITML